MPKSATTRPKGTRWNNALPSRSELHALKRDALLRQAGEAFSKKGFHNTTMDDVASELNVSKPALYYYFKNKYDILFECQKVALDLAEDAYSRAVAEGRSGREKTVLFVRYCTAALTSELGTCAVIMEYKAQRDEALDERIHARRRALDRLLQQLIVDGIADGSIGDCNPRLAVSFYMGAINTVQRWFSTGGSLSGESLADSYARLADNALAPASSPVATTARRRRPSRALAT